MAKLYLLVGLQGSGKSTLAKELNNDIENSIIISSDMIRKELFGGYDGAKNELVFQELHGRVNSNLSNGTNVIYDATNLSRNRRKHLIKQVFKKYDVECHVMLLDYEQVFAKNEARKVNDKHPIPKEHLERCIKHMDVPVLSEGFSKIVYHNRADHKLSIEFSLDEIIDKFDLKDYNQNNHHHKLTLDKHIEKVYQNVLNYGHNNPLSISMNDFGALLLAAMFHDIGKPYCRVDKHNGESCYYQHEKVSTYLAAIELTRNDQIPTCVVDTALTIILHHMRMNNQIDFMSEKAKKKFISDVGENNFRLIRMFSSFDSNAKE